jgi:hypothetical protein
VERWNGTSWAIQTNPTPEGSELEGVSCVSTTACTAVGYVGTPEPLIERWNGASWSPMPAPNPAGSTYTWLESVVCTSTTECIANGYYRNPSDQALTMKSS